MCLNAFSAITFCTTVSGALSGTVRTRVVIIDETGASKDTPDAAALTTSLSDTTPRTLLPSSLTMT